VTRKVLLGAIADDFTDAGNIGQVAELRRRYPI
jgi:hypothetical protein